MKRVLLAGVGLFAMASAAQPAVAADLSRAPILKAPAAAPIFNWTGFYAGAHAGWGWADVDWTFPDDDFFNLDPGDRFSHRPDGWLAGGHLGFNHQIGSTVFGIEGSFAGTDIDERSASRILSNNWFSTELGWLATVTARLGLAHDRALGYVKGGYAAGKVNLRLRDLEGIPELNRSAETHHGWTAGVGGEYAFASNWIFGIEYNYVDLGKKRHSASGTVPTTAIDVDMNIHTVSARLSYLFATSKAPVAVRY